MKSMVHRLLSVIALSALVVGCSFVGSLFGPTKEQIHDGALATLTAANDASVAFQKGTAPPTGITLDTTQFDYPTGSGTFSIIFDNYAVADPKGVVTSGTIKVTIKWEGAVNSSQIDSSSSGTVALSGYGVDSCTVDTLWTADVDDVVLWNTAAWSGTITVDGHEANLDELMQEYTDLMKAGT